MAFSDGRHEFKYIMTPDLAEIFMQEANGHLKPDDYGNAEGIYDISSLYYDTPRLDYYHQTYDKRPYRVKVRLRVYGNTNTPDSISFFETKAKLRGLSDKKRRMGTLAENLALFEGKVEPQTAVEKYIVNLIKKDNLQPTAIVSYNRRAFYDPDKPRLRVTFDSKLRIRMDDLDLTHGNHGIPVMGDDMLVLEVKNDENMPYWIAKLLGKYNLTNQSYSKYGQIGRLIHENEPYPNKYAGAMTIPPVRITGSDRKVLCRA